MAAFGALQIPKASHLKCVFYHSSFAMAGVLGAWGCRQISNGFPSPEIPYPMTEPYSAEARLK